MKNLKGKIARVQPYTLDKTLTVAGAAAEAEATGKAIDNEKVLRELHETAIDNPHNVTKAQLGLGAVDNTADMDKPVSTLQAEAIADAKRTGAMAQAKADEVAATVEELVTASGNNTTAAGNAQTRADEAYTLADTANTTANAAKTTAEAAQADFSANGAKLDSDGKVVANQATATVKYISGTEYTLTEEDIGKCLVQAYDGTADLTITLPAGFPVGAEVEIMRYNTYGVTIAAGSGATIRAAGYGTDITSVSIANRYGVVALKRIYSIAWIASGDIA